MIKLSATLVMLVITALFMNSCSSANASAVAFPNPKVDAPLATTKAEQQAVFAAGCFWGIEAVFDNVKGVSKAESGYQVVSRQCPVLHRRLWCNRSRRIRPRNL